MSSNLKEFCWCLTYGEAGCIMESRLEKEMKMKEPNFYKGSVVYYPRPNICLENNAWGRSPKHENSTFVWAVVDELWRYLGSIMKHPDGWHYMRAADYDTTLCASALDGINAILRAAGVVK